MTATNQTEIRAMLENSTPTISEGMKTYLAELNDGGKSESCETMDEARAYIANNFRTESDEIGTWNDEDGRTLVWMTQDAADAADDDSDVIATITESDA